MAEKITGFKLSTFLMILIFTLPSFSQSQKYEPELYSTYLPINSDSTVNVIVEIPAGSNQKWELNKKSGEIEWEIKNGKKRIVNYLPYPANYGMIPNTLLKDENGGDGDPLDVILLGEAVERGILVKARLLGILYLIDNNETDHKLIAVPANCNTIKANSIEELNNNYQGVLEIIRSWFTNYKGAGKLSSKGFGSSRQAFRILKNAINN